MPNHHSSTLHVLFMMLSMSLGVLLLLIAIVYLMKVLSYLLSSRSETIPPLNALFFKQVLGQLKSTGRTMGEWVKTHYTTLRYRLSHSQQKRILRRLPWYLVLGSPGSGKKTTLSNSGLYFASPEQIGEEADHYRSRLPDVEWWFSEQAVLLDALSYDKDRDQASLKKLIKLLKRERPHTPLNGIILTFSLPDLMRYSNPQRQEFIQDISCYIREIHERFQSQVPLYIIFTKCDQIEGFMEFFNDMSKEELLQVWGITLPLSSCNEVHAVQSVIHHEFSYLIQQLRKRVLWAFDSERNARGRELIHSFPQQMQLLKRPLEIFVLELFAATRHPKALQLRGLYFTSHKQEGESYDFLLTAMSKKFHLVPPVFTRPQSMAECYFARHIFPKIIYPESHTLGESERRKRRRALRYKSILLLLPTLLIFLVFVMHQGYKDNLVELQRVNAHLAHYQQAYQRLNQNEVSLTAVLPLLMELETAHSLYQHSPLPMNFLIATYSIQAHLQDALMRSLHSLFLPRIAAQIEAVLNQHLTDPTLLYATLKAYLAFSGQAYNNNAALETLMSYQWHHTLLKHSPIASQLHYFLNLALHTPLEALPLDRDLINQIRNTLQAIIPQERAYGLLNLNARTGDLAAIMLQSVLNNPGLFKLQDPTLMVPALFTRAGYESVFVKQYRSIAYEVAQDNQDIGLISTQDATQIANAIAIRYNHDYVHRWQLALHNMTVRPFNTLEQAIMTVRALSDEQSPVPKLLASVRDNTQDITDGRYIKISQSFESLNAYSDNLKPTSWQATRQVLTELTAYLSHIHTAANPNFAAFQAAQEIIRGKPNPLTDLSIQAQNAPEPIKTWLQTIEENCWQLIIQGAQQHMNQMWASQVLPEYNIAIKDRYPLNLSSQSQISIEDFTHFFGSKGTLSTYFQSYILPFVDTSTGHFKLYVQHGHSLPLPESTLQLFKQLNDIQKDYFPDQSPRANLKFSLQALSLDSHASSMSLTLGNTSWNYSHGPLLTRDFDWPLPFNNQLAALIINDFDSNQYGYSASGPWAMFKLFAKAHWAPAKNTGSYILSFEFKHYRVQFLLSGSVPQSRYQLSDLQGLSLPNLITPSKPGAP